MVVLHGNTNVDNAMWHADRTLIIPYICVITLYLECLCSACKHTTNDRQQRVRLLADRVGKYFWPCTRLWLLHFYSSPPRNSGHCCLPYVCLHGLHKYAENITITNVWFPINMLHTSNCNNYTSVTFSNVTFRIEEVFLFHRSREYASESLHSPSSKYFA
jgi:hypothetical protein